MSWGTLLQDARNFQAVSRQPWLLIPCLFVVLTVLLYNFLGDGLRLRRSLFVTLVVRAGRRCRRRSIGRDAARRYSV